jgi:hypothetical protein
LFTYLQAAAGKDAKGGKGAPPPAKAPAGKATGGKKGTEITPDEEATQRPVLAKIGLKPRPKAESSKSWSRERQLLEIQYRREFSEEVRSMVHYSVKRMCGLFEDVATSQRDIPTVAELKVKDTNASGSTAPPPSGLSGPLGSLDYSAYKPRKPTLAEVAKRVISAGKQGK